MDDILDDFEDKQPKRSAVPSIIYLSIAIVGYIFKIQHWPGGSFFILLGLALVSGYSIARFIADRPITKFVWTMFGGSILAIYYALPFTLFLPRPAFGIEGFMLFLAILIVAGGIHLIILKKSKD